MANFSLVVVLSLVTIVLLLCTRVMRHSAIIYLFFLLVADLIFIILRTITK